MALDIEMKGSIGYHAGMALGIVWGWCWEKEGMNSGQRFLFELRGDEDNDDLRLSFLAPL